MALTQTLVLKQTQRLIMTQDLRQSIELLPLSTQELYEKIQSELIENPMLEEVSNPEKAKNPELYSAGEVKKLENIEFAKNTDVSWQDTYSIDRPGIMDDEASDKNQKLIESSDVKEKLSDHLLSQLRLQSVTEEEYALGELLISMLDDRGFIEMPMQDLAREINFPVNKLDKVLKMIHRLEPLGIGTKNIQESLLIQANILLPEDACLRELLSDHFHELEKLDYKKISKNMKISEEEVEDIAKAIKKLHPFPASKYNSRKIDYVIPDVVIHESEGEFSIIINDEWLPKLSINAEYKEALPTIRNSVDKEYITTKMNSAQWLIRSINQRRQTLYRVVNSIIEFQIDFFRKGISDIKPLTLRDIAEKLNMSESTVSRITTNKYVQTSWGVLELKWFFSSGVKSLKGGMESSKKIHDIIKNLIKEEDELNPLSDQDIVVMIERQGIEIARRTVAKYRKILKILPANRRKRLRDLNGR